MASQARDVVERYARAWEAKDFDAHRALLADDLSFQGPFESLEDADSYSKAIQGLAPLITGIDVKRIVVEGDSVGFFYDLVTDTPIGRTPCAEHIEVRDDKIASIRVYFDARPWAEFRAAHS